MRRRCSALSALISFSCSAYLRKESNREIYFDSVISGNAEIIRRQKKLPSAIASSYFFLSSGTLPQSCFSVGSDIRISAQKRSVLLLMRTAVTTESTKSSAMTPTRTKSRVRPAFSGNAASAICISGRSTLTAATPQSPQKKAENSDVYPPILYLLSE